MKADVEKVITISLTKMAESRGLRRGGSSLHKHLLISSVLTKARTAYLDSWCASPSDHESRPSGAPKLIVSAEGLGEEDQATLLDTRSLFQLDGTEMDLPTDILNCVEKMGGIPNVGFSLASDNAAGTDEDETEEEQRATAELILAEFVDDLSTVESSSKSYTYLDLDQSTAQALVTNLSSDDSTHSLSTTTPSKRRREWSFDTDEDSTDSDDIFPGTLLGTKRIRFALSENYTFCSTNGTDENTIPAGTSMLMSISTTPYTSSGNRTPLEPFFTFKGNNFNFRTKTSQFEDYEEETVDENESPFLYDDEDFDECDTDYGIGDGEKRRNDRRVPSSTGSCSSSDEEHEQDTAMDLDLDKVTSLFQYISFNKGTGTTGMVRSISTPNLLSYTKRSSDGSSSSTMDKSPASSTTNNTNTKDLYSSYFSSHSPPSYHQQRVLTMKV